jgi:hypothetical protein
MSLSSVPLAAASHRTGGARARAICCSKASGWLGDTKRRRYPPRAGSPLAVQRFQNTLSSSLCSAACRCTNGRRLGLYHRRFRLRLRVRPGPDPVRPPKRKASYDTMPPIVLVPLPYSQAPHPPCHLQVETRNSNPLVDWLDENEARRRAGARCQPQQRPYASACGGFH